MARGAVSVDAIERLDVSAYRVPTEQPRSDATRVWDHTTVVVVHARAGAAWGLGYTYADAAAAEFLQHVLANVIVGRDLMAISGGHLAMEQAVREAGRPGIASSAISAIDAALWDLKARVLNLPLARLLGSCRQAVPIYGSGGFTSLSISQLEAQAADWMEQGMPRIKIKVGDDPEKDPDRVAAVRRVIGPETELFVDGNGGYDRKQALRLAETFAEQGVTWFEEPVTSDDLEGLRLLRDRAPAGMEIAAGEYGFDNFYFRRMLEAGAVDVLQADARRCGGVTGLSRAATLSEAFNIPLSTHTAPALHLHPCCALPSVRHVEYFSEHVRVERLLFDGAASPVDGLLHADLSAPGMGLTLKRSDAERFAI